MYGGPLLLGCEVIVKEGGEVGGIGIARHWIGSALVLDMPSSERSESVGAHLEGDTNPGCSVKTMIAPT